VYKIGLKLWSSNKNYVIEAQRLFDNGNCHYIELFVEPGTLDSCVEIWKVLKIPFIIHAPHFTQGVNLAKAENFEQNITYAREALRFADELGAGLVIFHPGVAGDIKETIRQLRVINDKRILIENKPYSSCDGNYVCNGHSPEEIAFIMKEVGVGFCLDVSHAVCAANSKKTDPIVYLGKFLKMRPLVFHIADGDWGGIYDEHEHIGRGSFRFDEVFTLLPLGAMVTIEARHDFKDSLVDFEEDVAVLKGIINQSEVLDFDFFSAKEADLDDLYVLANEAEARRNSLSSAEIPWKDHIAWFNEKLQSDSCIFYVIRNKLGVLVGQVRFDRILGNENGYVVSFGLAKDFRGRGLGTRLLQGAMKKLYSKAQPARVVAYIKKENEASLKCFLHVGFRLLGEMVLHDNDVYQLQFSFGGDV